MIIMHFIVNETNNTQVFQCQHLTEQRYKKKEKRIPYKTPKLLIITLRCSKRNSKTKCKYSSGNKVLLAKSSWWALIRIHSCVNLAWGKTLGKINKLIDILKKTKTQIPLQFQSLLCHWWWNSASGLGGSLRRSALVHTKLTLERWMSFKPGLLYNSKSDGIFVGNITEEHQQGRKNQSGG